MSPSDRSIGLGERLEQVLLLLGLNALAGVRDAEGDSIASGRGLLEHDRQRYRTCVRELHGIIQEIEKNLPEPGLVSEIVGRQSAIDVDAHLESFALRASTND